MDVDIADLANRLNLALDEVLDPDDFDVVFDSDGELNVSTDDWTLHFEGWPSGPAWLAIDDEPEDPEQFAAALSGAMGEKIIRTLRQVDVVVSGRLTRALVAGSDQFSQVLVESLAHMDCGDRE